MAAATLFFILERFEVNPKWRTSLTVAALITGIAFWHYLRMSSVWIDTGTSPTRIQVHRLVHNCSITNS